MQPEGVYGASTRKAIEAWQEARGRETTGFLGNDDALALQREGAPEPDQPPQALGPAPTPPPNSDEVPLKYAGGTYTVPVLINGMIPLDFTVDSGASDVTLPADVVMTLIRTGTITDDDYIGKEKYRLGDGTVVDSERFYLRQLKVGNHVLEHVAASIQKFESGPLLGQSFLSKFDFWALDNRRHVLVLGAGGGAPLTRNGAGQLAPVVPGKP